jgi:hypothetical protein
MLAPNSLFGSKTFGGKKTERLKSFRPCSVIPITHGLDEIEKK